MSNKEKILDLLDEGALSAEKLSQMLISFLSEDEAGEVLRLNGLDEYYEDDFIDDDDDDENEEFSFDPDEMKARARAATDAWMAKRKNNDVYYDPTDGYKDTEGLHNSIEEAEDDYYENDYKVNIPEDEDGFESEEDVRAFYNKD